MCTYMHFVLFMFITLCRWAWVILWLVWMSLNHPVLLAWQQVSVGNIIECFDYTGTPMSNMQCDKCSVPHFVCNLLQQWWELQLQQCWSFWWWLVYILQSSGTSEGKLQLTMVVCYQKSVLAQKLKSRILGQASYNTGATPWHDSAWAFTTLLHVHV